MNGSLGSIMTMYIRRDKLVPNLLLVHNGGFKFGADFIVKDLEINIVPTVGKEVHDGVIVLAHLNSEQYHVQHM